jgi:hypothetical protein
VLPGAGQVNELEVDDADTVGVDEVSDVLWSWHEACPFRFGDGGWFAKRLQITR